MSNLGHVPDNQLWKYRKLRTIRDHLDIAAENLFSPATASPEMANAYSLASQAREIVHAQMMAMRVAITEEPEVADV
jgi:hypothetical protein